MAVILEKMKVDNYITGASGFIGSHLIDRLSGQTNRCLTNAQRDEPELDDHRRIFFLSTYGNLAEHNNWEEIVNANVTQVAKMLTASAVHEGSDGPFIFVSSSSVTLPIQTPYSRCKRAGEEIVLSLDDTYRGIVIRPYSVTGVGDHKVHLIPKLIHSCFSGEEMPFAPDATHDWIDVEDVVDGMLLLSEKAERGIYELGNGFARSNKFVRGVVEAVTGQKANCVPWEGRAYDNAEWYCKDLAARQLGWYPKRTLLDSIEGMVEDYLKNEPAKTQVC